MDAVLGIPYGVLYNCYFSFFLLFDEGGMFYSDEVMLNVLFNLGYMYEDLKNIVVKATNSDYQSDFYEAIGYWIGDFIVRFFYRK